ncbi:MULTISPECIES: acyltransferase family protein [Micrococcus]|uniref:acyltransferase family protein n=1 Tax=Micrococcus TaxID=1269 RepID=UPI00044EC4C0|nr:MULTISPECIES: acyltransferase [Micrococcus]EZP30997.1 Acyltransferase [Micrococcus luteus]MBY0173970.1 acyltransferase [Micrococcus luteus]MCD0179387.1 acyltransferase [Micrococcus luteus]MCD0181092.1 acyltransferase [Micrococcus luteus]MCF8559640.1 acyltransferase [Micrococcus yunnanensis]
MTAASPNEPGSVSVAPAEKRVPGPRFRELDGLRGLAALAVVFSHYTGAHNSHYPQDPAAFHDAAWGAAGVQLFFIISGFVIFMSARRADRPSDFAISRAARLYPPYWISLVFAVVLLLLHPVPGFPFTWGQALVNLTMVQRWVGVDNVVDVYWTLAVEMQFYVIILILLYLTRCRLSDRVVLWGSLAWSVISWAVVLFTAPHVGSDPQRDPLWVKLLNNATVAEYAPLFVLGMALYIARQTGQHRGWVAAAAVSAVGSTFVMRGMPLALEVLVVVLLAVTVMLRERTSVLLLAPVQWYGKISYSLYILHAIPGYILIHALWPYVGRNMAMLVALAVVSVLAWALQKYGEEHLGRAAKRGLTRVRSVVDARTGQPRSLEPAR